MLRDRGLTLEQLEVVRRVVIADPDPRSNRRQLTIALRDLVSDQEAMGKTKICVTRVWLNPPSEAEAMIVWGRLFDGPPSVSRSKVGEDDELPENLHGPEVSPTRLFSSSAGWIARAPVKSATC